ncbi:MAG TPA: hypothetical protein VHY37_13305, partial [Tepidisphaeraceae bacterium]|nr:hypothetical protein [Tepidisphaeraceae bacterium]
MMVVWKWKYPNRIRLAGEPARRAGGNARDGFRAEQARRLSAFHGWLLMLTIVAALPMTAQARGGNAFPARPALDAQQAKLETDLALMLEQQAQGPSTVLEFQIDMHILARWLTELSASAPPRSPLQASAFLRADEIINCSAMLSAKLNAAPITAVQADALARLHKLTFKLPNIKDVAKLDDFCKDAAIDLIAANGPLPAGMHDVPLMRPKPIADRPGPAAPAAAPPPPRTLAQLVDEANHASVSPALHAQLVALASAASAAANAPNAGEEASTLSAMLEQVMDLVTGLQTNVGVSADDREKMEQSLTDGVALFADPRMRSAGRRRIESLDQYRRNLDRIRNLHLSPEMSAKFSLAFVFADQNPDTGNEVMEDIQKWMSLTDEFDKHAPPPGLTSNQTRVIEAMQKQFATQREAFLADAGTLSAAADGTFSASPADLTAHLPKMQDAINTIQLVERANMAMTALLPYHPRPT